MKSREQETDMRAFVGPIAALLLCLSTIAGADEFCGALEKDDCATSELRPDPATANVLDRHTSQRGLDFRKAGAELKGATGQELDRVVGHLRLVAREAVGERRSDAVWVLNEMLVEGRADVASLFIECLGWDELRARRICANRLRNAPDSKRAEAVNALFQNLSTETDPIVFKSSLLSLGQLATPESRYSPTPRRDRRQQLWDLLREELPKGIEPDLFTAWKKDEARIVIRILGPEDATALFQSLDPSKPGQRAGIEGAVAALREYAVDQFNAFPEVTTIEADRLRDLVRSYGVEVLSQDSFEAAKRDAGIRLEAAKLLWVVVSGRVGGSREVDVAVVRDAFTYALGFERDDSRVASAMTSALEWLSSPPARARDAATRGAVEESQ